MKTVISFDLSEGGISRAIDELNRFKADFQRKCDLVTEKIAYRIRDEAQAGFSGAIVDDLTERSGGAKKANVVCDVIHSGRGFVVRANGTDAVWVEFGAGVHHNGSAGQSPNPYGKNLQFVIGGFGYNGVKDTWVFSENGEKKFTHGTPAGMPMYRAVQKVSDEIAAIAREVFG